MYKKRVEDSLTEQTYLVMHRHINGYGRLFGGQLLAIIPEQNIVISILSDMDRPHPENKKIIQAVIESEIVC